MDDKVHEILERVSAEYDTYPARLTSARERYLDYPRNISIETQVKCNAKCDFCPYPVSSRKGEEMDEALFYKIISDLQSIPHTHKFGLALCRINEPLLDPRLEEFHRAIKEMLPNARLQFWSNGTTLRPGKFEWMAEFSGASLSVSLNSVDEDEHRDMMGFGLKAVLPNLDYVHSLKSEGKFPVQVSLRAPFDNPKQAKDFMQYTAERWPLFNNGLRPYFVWTGDIDVGSDQRSRTQEFIPKQRSVAGLGCAQWFDLHILSNGYVTKCCIDEAGFVGEELFDCQTRHVLDVYGESRNLRASLPGRSGVTGCEDCLHLG